MPEQSTSSTSIHWSATEDGRVMRSIATQTDPPPLSMDDFILAEHCARIAVTYFSLRRKMLFLKKCNLHGVFYHFDEAVCVK